MTEPTRYSIEVLLNSGAQPFPDLDDEALTALGKGIGNGPLAVPVSISSDGVLLDGHQRLKAMRTAGRTFISGSDVRIIPKANKKNALEWAIRLNVQRRQLSVEEKAELARRIQRERHWSLGKIAELFGVSRPAVSKWLANTDGDDDAPGTVIGADGKSYPMRGGPIEDRAAPIVGPGAIATPWAAKGTAFRNVRAATKSMHNNAAVGDVGPVQEAKVKAELGNLIDAATHVLEGMDVVADDHD